MVLSRSGSSGRRFRGLVSISRPAYRDLMTEQGQENRTLRRLWLRINVSTPLGHPYRFELPYR